MNYKKIVSLLAVSLLTLTACGSDEVEETGENSSQDLMEQAEEGSGTASPEYGLEVTGEWSVDGYEINYAPGEEATVPVTILTDKEDYNVYLLEDSLIKEIKSNEEEVSFLVADPSEEVEYYVGVSPEDLGEVGDEISTEEFVRSEEIVFEEAEEEEEAAE